MANLVVLLFDGEQEAYDVLATMRRLEDAGAVSLEDTAVLSKDDTGTLHVGNQVSDTTRTGAVVGGVLGLLLMFMFPVAGLSLGALSGAGVAATLYKGVDPEFVEDVSEALKPGKSALFLLIASAQPAVLDALSPYSGRVYQSTLSPELEERLEKALA
jgi:uncharacterized membrane protein